MMLLDKLTGKIRKYTVDDYVQDKMERAMLEKENKKLRRIIGDLRQKLSETEEELELSKGDNDQKIELEDEVRELTDRVDTLSDRLDYEIFIGNRHEKRAERLAWFIGHLSEQLRELANEVDNKRLDDCDIDDPDSGLSRA